MKMKFEDVKDNIIDLYFEKRLSKQEVSSQLGISVAMVSYYTCKTGYTLASYVYEKYSKEYLESILKANTVEKASIILNLPFQSLRYLLTKKGIKLKEYRKKNLVSRDFLDNHNTKYKKEFWYFLGLVASDGYIKEKSNSIRISIKNKGAKDLLTNLGIAIGHSNVLKTKSDFYEITFNSKELIGLVKQYGIPSSNKTYLLQDVKIEDKESLFCFMAGLIDGDGNLATTQSIFGYKTSFRVSVSNYNKEFLYNLSIYIKEYAGYNSVIYEPRIGGKTHNYSLNINKKNNSVDFMKELYNTSPLYLSCKHKIFYDYIHQ
jgi:hypothetical protein